MRRFSQRSYLVTLSEINITPLLDLAFVLLIIFVITTPLLEQSINLKLPRGGQPDKFVNKRDIRTVEVSTTGVYALDRQRMPFDELIARLAAEFRANPNLIVYIRADKDSRTNTSPPCLTAASATASRAIRSAPNRPNEPAAKKMRHRDGGHSPAAAGDFGRRPGVLRSPDPKRTTCRCSMSSRPT